MGNLDIQKGKFSSELQEKFLNICNYFVSEGVAKLCESVSETVKRCTAKITLNQKLSLVDLEAVINDVFENCKTLESDRNIFNNPGIFFLPTSENFLSDIHPSDQGVLKQMFAETMDVLDSEDSISMAHLVCKQGLGYTVDKIAEYYAAIGISGSMEKPSPTNPLTKNALHDSGFVSPANVSLPLAKLIPILSAQVRAPPDEDDAWLSHLQENPAIKLLGQMSTKLPVSQGPHLISHRQVAGESICTLLLLTGFVISNTSFYVLYDFCYFFFSPHFKKNFCRKKKKKKKKK